MIYKNVLCFVLLAIPVAAFAQDAELVFNALDNDSDGRITQQEAQLNELVTENFSDADINSDGVLSLAEFTSAFGSA